MCVYLQFAVCNGVARCCCCSGRQSCLVYCALCRDLLSPIVGAKTACMCSAHWHVLNPLHCTPRPRKSLTHQLNPPTQPSSPQHSYSTAQLQHSTAPQHHPAKTRLEDPLCARFTHFHPCLWSSSSSLSTTTACLDIHIPLLLSSPPIVILFFSRFSSLLSSTYSITYLLRPPPPPPADHAHYHNNSLLLQPTLNRLPHPSGATTTHRSLVGPAKNRTRNHQPNPTALARIVGLLIPRFSPGDDAACAQHSKFLDLQRQVKHSPIASHSSAVALPPLQPPTQPLRLSRLAPLQATVLSRSFR